MLKNAEKALDVWRIMAISVLTQVSNDGGVDQISSGIKAMLGKCKKPGVSMCYTDVNKVTILACALTELVAYLLLAETFQIARLNNPQMIQEHIKPQNAHHVALGKRRYVVHVCL